ncbi:hypothetical protein PUP75_05070 [Pseudomonas chlororaphis]|uniref:hypothetical protein n=1 Tax=Pseudomonas chlororaphis TaxID=587753 RepID=UPI0023681D37|nr:hypothetical protein [Pseudomonas chlororaphis]WDH54167.1 hypothetical protein PUP75_05070 [Pseudomonas chlororaphis]
MKLALTYLSRNRHGTFYFRVVIPASLLPLVNSKRKIRSSTLALKRARHHAVRFDLIFDRALRMTERNDYEHSQENFDLYEKLHIATMSACWSEERSSLRSTTSNQLH